MAHTHKFDVGAKDRLESEGRKKLLAPSETLRKLGYRKGSVMADIGCGTGLFTFSVAELCSGESPIYAVDVSEEMLSTVKERAKVAGYSDIQAVKSEEYDFKLGDGSVDFVLICAVLHEIGDKTRFLREAARICQAGGTVAVIEFSEAETGFGPPPGLRLTKGEIGELLMDVGFCGISELEISEGFYAVTAEK